MKRRLLTALVPVIAVLCTIWGLAIAQRNKESAFGSVGAVEQYFPDGNNPGLIASFPVNAEDLTFPVEFDVRLDKTVQVEMEVADAEIRANSGKPPRSQPSFAQETPNGVDARLLLTALEPGDYTMNIYLRGKNEKVVPEKWMTAVRYESALRLAPVSAD